MKILIMTNSLSHLLDLNHITSTHARRLNSKFSRAFFLWHLIYSFCWAVQSRKASKVTVLTFKSYFTPQFAQARAKDLSLPHFCGCNSLDMSSRNIGTWPQDGEVDYGGAPVNTGLSRTSVSLSSPFVSHLSQTCSTVSKSSEDIAEENWFFTP